ncbi:MAG: hypothetical protein ACD_4C00249G0004 [uncultured bacterium (gcode 4)]|uniref:Uncharacterized protein n=1 Tax=uncultured bacterium (gcode 4) TaxID=1234023 RepID=K2G8T9_9BACT|nr:MAG: hypothetical protein ACD_4C00249G0004 [uncultured bacterium (gcode 4)]
MIEILNQNQWVIATIAILITIVWFYITNNNIVKVNQKQTSWNNSNNNQIWYINNSKKND